MSNPLIKHHPLVRNLTVWGPGSYERNRVDFDGVAVYLMVSNYGEGNVLMYLNDQDEPISLLKNQSYEFPLNSIHLSSVSFDNSQSGADSADIEVIAGVMRG